MHIRMMAESDKIVLSKIYLEGIEEGNATFETSIDRKAWFIQLDQSKVIVLENKKELVGFIKLTPISSRKVYKGVNEVSLYIRGDERGKVMGVSFYHTRSILLRIMESGCYNRIFSQRM